MKDWTGNSKSTFSTLGASNHSDYDRAERDFYATSPEAIDGLLKHIFPTREVWENAAGNGHLSQRLTENGFDVFSSDIVARDYPVQIIDFLKEGMGKYLNALACRDVLTNPPYKYAQEWVEKSMEVLAAGGRLFLFLKLTFLEGQKRKELFKKYPPRYVLVFSKRIQVAINGDPKMFEKSSAACYAWFVWEKGFQGDPIIKWI
jgi:hypothetical protein